MIKNRICATFYRFIEATQRIIPNCKNVNRKETNYLVFYTIFFKGILFIIIALILLTLRVSNFLVSEWNLDLFSNMITLNEIESVYILLILAK